MQSAICTYLISITRRTRSQILLFESKISLASKYMANVFINSVYFGKVDFFFFNWTFNNALVPRRVNIHLEFWHLVYTNSCSDGRTGISNGSMIPKLVDFWVCFYCEFDPIFFINSKLIADFLIYVFLITSTSCCNFQTLCSMSTMTSAP